MSESVLILLANQEEIKGYETFMKNIDSSFPEPVGKSSSGYWNWIREKCGIAWDSIFIGARAPFGYQFSENKKVLAVDEVAAQYVRRIFGLACQGCGTEKIAQILNVEQTFWK